MIRFMIKTILVVAVVFFILPFVAVVGLGFLGNKDTAADSNDPGKELFEEMNKRIGAYRDVEAFGNTPEAQTIAQDFAMMMKAVREESFTKGKEGALSLSKGHFLTYCHADADAVVVLCHVPEFRRFQDDAKAALMQIAWSVAQSATEKTAAKTRRMVVGLRGVALYYQFWSGNSTGKPAHKRDHSDGRRALYLELAPPTAQVPTPSAPTGVPPVPTPIEADGSAHRRFPGSFLTTIHGPRLATAIKVAPSVVM